MKKKYLLPILILLSSCSYSHVKKVDGFTTTELTGNTSFEQPSVTNYELIKKKILVPKCLKCHSDSGGNQGGLNLERYDDITKALASINQRTLIDKTMPPGRALTSEELLLLYTWIASGASLDGKTGGINIEQNPKPTVVWSQIKNEVFSTKCIQCHSLPIENPTPETATTLEAGLNLNDYEMVKSKAELILKRIVITNDMPLNPYPRLSSSEKKLIIDWMIQGMYNDEAKIEESKQEESK